MKKPLFLKTISCFEKNNKKLILQVKALLTNMATGSLPMNRQTLALIQGLKKSDAKTISECLTDRQIRELFSKYSNFLYLNKIFPEKEFLVTYLFTRVIKIDLTATIAALTCFDQGGISVLNALPEDSFGFLLENITAKQSSVLFNRFPAPFIDNFQNPDRAAGLFLRCFELTYIDNSFYALDLLAGLGARAFFILSRLSSLDNEILQIALTDIQLEKILERANRLTPHNRKTFQAIRIFYRQLLTKKPQDFRAYYQKLSRREIALILNKPLDVINYAESKSIFILAFNLQQYLKDNRQREASALLLSSGLPLANQLAALILLPKYLESFLSFVFSKVKALKTLDLLQYLNKPPLTQLAEVFAPAKAKALGEYLFDTQYLTGSEGTPLYPRKKEAAEFPALIVVSKSINQGFLPFFKALKKRGLAAEEIITLYYLLLNCQHYYEITKKIINKTFENAFDGLTDFVGIQPVHYFYFILPLLKKDQKLALLAELTKKANVHGLKKELNKDSPEFLEKMLEPLVNEKTAQSFIKEMLPGKKLKEELIN